MKNKRLLSLLLAAATTASLFSGACCSAEETQELEEKTIQIWLCGNKQQDSEKVWDKFNEMLQEYVPNTTVEFSIFPSSEYNEKFQQMLASGEGVDVAWAANWITGNVNDAIRDGNYMAVDELLAEYGQDIIDILSQEVVDFHRKADGKIYYLPTYPSLIDNKRGMCVSTEIANLAGETWIADTEEAVNQYWNEARTPEAMQTVFDQIVKYCEAAEAAGKLGAGLPWSTLLGWTYNLGLSSAIPLSCNIGVQNGDDTFTVVDGHQTEFYRVYAKNMADLYQRGYIRKDSASVDTSTLSTPKDGVIDENTYIMRFHNILSSNTAETLTKEWGMEVTTIALEKNVSLVKGETTMNVIPYCADEPERAMMVMNAIYTVPELYQTLIWGIEGEHWTDNGDGTVNYTGGGSGSDATYGYDDWKIGNCVNGLITQDTDPDYYDEMVGLVNTAYVTPFENFVFDTTGLEDVTAALNAVTEEYQGQITGGYTGENWETILETFISERKAAGVDQLIAAYQEQLNAYIEENGITSF